MKPDIRVSVDQGVIRIVYRGSVEPAVTTGMLREIGRLAAESRSKSLLFDIRETDYSRAHVRTIRHVEEAESLGVLPSFQIALLGPLDNPMVKYIEDVAVNRGFQVQVFGREDEAMSWLHQPR